jgi:hypothetical protein
MAAKRRVATLALALAAAVATVTAVPVGHAMDELSLQADRGGALLPFPCFRRARRGGV